jgi:hypothetical protein
MTHTKEQIMKKVITALSIVALVSCGADESKEEHNPVFEGYYVRDIGELPPCIMDNVGQLAYEFTEQAFYGCDSDGEWVKISPKAAIVEEVEIVDEYIAVGDGTNLCDKYEFTDCYLEAIFIQNFSNGLSQTSFSWSESNINGAYVDTSDDVYANMMMTKTLKDEGRVRRLTKRSIRADTTTGNIFAKILPDLKKVQIIIDTNNDFIGDENDTIVQEIDLKPIK